VPELFLGLISGADVRILEGSAQFNAGEAPQRHQGRDCTAELNNPLAIYFIIPDLDGPAGGAKQIYRQVDILNRNNIRAAVLHRSPESRFNWFENQTNTAYSKQLFDRLDLAELAQFSSPKAKLLRQAKRWRISVRSFLSGGAIKQCTPSHFSHQWHPAPADILVFPEIIEQLAPLVMPETRKVIFNQNCFYSGLLNTPGKNKADYSFASALIVASDYGFRFMQTAAPGVSCYRIFYGFDDRRFKPRANHNKRRQICWMPRKLPRDASLVVNLLYQKLSTAGWSFMAIENCSEVEVATIMAESEIFLSFGHTEGFGMPPLEAMLSECVVVGYAAQGGVEYFGTPFCRAVPDQDVIAFANEVERLTMEEQLHPGYLQVLGKQARAFVQRTYSLEKEQDSILNTWRLIIHQLDSESPHWTLH
jgi:hypothetical protein